MGRCEFPIYLTPDKAEAWFDMWRIINETRMTRNNWTSLGENTATVPPSLKLFRSIAEQNQQRIRSRYLRTLALEGNPGSMDDVPCTQICEDDEVDEDLPIAEPNVTLGLPTEIALVLHGPNPCWNSPSCKRTRDNLDTSSAKLSKPNEPEDAGSNHEMGLDEFGLPMGTWEDFLMDITADDLQNAANFPLAGWAP